MKKKTIVIVILCIVALIVLLLIFLKNRKIENPIIAELQAMIEKEVGPDFKISKGELYSKDPFSSITVCAGDRQYFDESIFKNVNEIQKIIYNYARTHKDSFIMNYNYNNEDLGFKIYFKNKDVADAVQNVIIFTNYIKEEDWYSDEYVAVTISTTAGYPYKLSQLTVLENVKELNISKIDIDKVDALKHISGLKYLCIAKYPSDEIMKKIEKISKELGIFVE